MIKDETSAFQDLSKFYLRPSARGRSPLIIIIWQIVRSTLFLCSPQPLYSWRRQILRLFGAKVGKKVKVRSSVVVTYPWKVTIDENSWIGDGAVLYSLDEISIGRNAVVSQGVYLCTGSHDYNDVTFKQVTAPISVADEAWIAAQCFVMPGVRIGKGSVIAARSLVLSDVEQACVYGGSPARYLKKRLNV